MYDPANGMYDLSDSDFSPPSLDEAHIGPIDRFPPVSGRGERPLNPGARIAAAFGLRHPDLLATPSAPDNPHTPRDLESEGGTLTNLTKADEKNDILAGDYGVEVYRSPSPSSRASTLFSKTEHKKRNYESASDEADDDQDDEKDDEKPESDGDTASPYWDAISKRVVTHISFEGLCMPWRTHIRRNVLYKQKLSDLRQYYTTYRQWGKSPKKKEGLIEAILEKEKEALAG
ncbi:hypothetical protein KCU83_g1216, partial [Aureobasidium melanogenum]